ncbi:MAG: DNA repair protein RecO [Candidatus Eisenbacteria bacterium]
MAIEREEAIVLSRSRFGETSLIVTLFTRGRGPLRFMVKGARRPRSRFGGCLEPTNHLLAVYYRKEGRDLHLLAQADLVASFPGLRGSLLRLAYAYAIIDALVGLKREETPAEKLFRLALEALGTLDGGAEEDLEPALWSFLLAALADAGYRPELERCLRCGRVVRGSGARFDSRAGGVVCARHGEGGLSLSAGTIEFLGGLAAGARRKTPLTRRETAEGREALRRFLQEHGLGRAPFRSLEILAPSA